MLLDRLPERAALSGLLEAARAGSSGVLVLRGEPGVGKTALLDWVIGSAAGLRVARVAGVESEMELAFAALQQLCAPMLDKLGGLPDPQRAALGVAFGLSTAAAAVVFAAGERGEEFRGLPELPVGGLRDDDARELLGSVIAGPLDEWVRD